MDLVNMGNAFIDPSDPRFSGNPIVTMAKAALEHGEPSEALGLLEREFSPEHAQQLLQSMQESVQESAHNMINYVTEPRFGSESIDPSHVHDAVHYVVTEHLGEMLHHVGSFLLDLFS